MRHRLLHTLVFSSSFLVDGCAMSHVIASDAGSPPADAPSPVPDAADAAVAADAFSPPDASDPRECEPGWPTTKGSFSVERDGVSYSCAFGAVDADSSDLSLCCVVVPEAP